MAQKTEEGISVRVYTFVDDKDKTPDINWWQKFCLRCHQPETTPSSEPLWWGNVFPFPIFPTFRQTAQQICIIVFFLLIWGILFAEIGEPVSLNGELLSMTLLVIASYLVGWIWLKVTTLPALIGMLLTGILFQNLHLVHMTDTYRQLNQDLRKIALVIILMRAGLGLNADVLKKHYIAVLQLGLLPWLVECVAIAVMSHYLLSLPWIWGFLLGSMIASVSPAVVVPCLFRLREVGYGVAKGIPTLLLAAASIDDSVSVAVFAIILNAMFSSGSTTFNIIKVNTPRRGMGQNVTSVIPENKRGQICGPLAIVSSGFMAAYFWEKQGWPVNNNPVSNLFRILWIFFEPILFAFTGAQVTLSALDPDVISMGAICLLSCLALRVIATFLISFGCGLNSKEKLFIGLTWMAKATVQAALGPAALDLVKSGKSAGDTHANEEIYAKTILAMSVLSVVISAPAGAIFIALTGPRLLSKESQPKTIETVESIETIVQENGMSTDL
ncbi:unnamed protein product [Pieris macdunnoughi]|uniref:Cation/H+ exchanger transmembrane domain-containing protein n=1 Tax=Pieris macdunnoughi TaxID=345717 RepID=A0A821R4G3_9NEOP|nr:unnamed protein product [Pieris macdunnoughi]